MSFPAVSNGLTGLSPLKDEGLDGPSWVEAGEAGPSGPKPSLGLTFCDLLDEVCRRLARKGHPWEW